MADFPAVDEKAFSYAQDAAKQVLTLSTGVLTLSVTFFDKFTDGPNLTARAVMPWSWVTLALSVVFGLLFLFALTGNLGRGRTALYEARNAMILSGLQQLTFVLGLVLAVWAGVDALGAAPPLPVPEKP